MNKILDQIMQDYKNGATLEETNKRLAEFGLSLDPTKNPEGGWTEAEMEEGFLPGQPSEPLPDGPDMSRIPSLAGMPPVIQKTKKGTFKVFRDEDGYAVKAIKV